MKLDRERSKSLTSQTIRAKSRERFKCLFSRDKVRVGQGLSTRQEIVGFRSGPVVRDHESSGNVVKPIRMNPESYSRNAFKSHL